MSIESRLKALEDAVRWLQERAAADPRVSGSKSSVQNTIEDDGNPGRLADVVETAQNANTAGQRSDVLALKVGDGPRAIDRTGNVGYVGMCVGEKVDGTKVAVSELLD